MIAPIPFRLLQAATLLLGGLLQPVSLSPALAAQVGPPMLDISRQCDAVSRHNATAMSECVVAESEARTELLQNWSKISDAEAERCVKLGRKAKRLPYTAMARCMTPPVAAEPAPAAHRPQ